MNTCENHEIKITLPNIKPDTSRNPLSTLTEFVFNNINSQFKRITGVDFAEAQFPHNIGLAGFVNPIFTFEKSKNKALVCGE